MKCSQVTYEVLCRFHFQNTADEDYYILEDKTPLEGLRYPYLTISQEYKLIKYEGIHVSRMAPTKDSYVLIEAGKTITSPVVDLTSSYKFDSDGIYTIEYTKPFVYISDAEMSMIEYDKDLPQVANYDDLVASTKVHLEDVFKLKPTDAEILKQRMAFLHQEDNNYDDDDVNTQSCPMKSDISIEKGAHVDKKIAESAIVIHEMLCDKNRGIQKAVFDALLHSNKKPYTNFFSAEYKHIVHGIVKKCSKNLAAKGTMEYVFYGSRCTPKSTAYAQHGINVIYICPLYDKMPELAKVDSRLQIIAHEMTHIFGKTKDYFYTYDKCREMSKSKLAPDNADSLSFYVQEVMMQKA